MSRYFRDWLWPTFFTYQQHRRYALTDVGCSLVLSAFPALNVLAVGFLGARISSGESIVTPLLCMILLFGAGNAFTQFTYSYGRTFAGRLEGTALSTFVHKVAKAPAYVYSDQEYLEAMRQARGACEYSMMSAQYQAINNICCGLFVCASLCWSLWNYSSTVALISIFLPIPVLVNFLIYGKQEALFWPLLNAQERRRDYLEDQLTHDRTAFDLSSMGGTGVFAGLIDQVLQQWYKISYKMHKFALFFCTIAGAISALIYAVCLGILVYEGELVSLLAGVFGLSATISAIEGLGYQIGMLQECIPSNRALREFIARADNEVTRVSVAQAVQVNFQDVRVSYGTRQVVKGVNLELRRNRLTALVGANGSGKTTLIKALMGLQQNASGNITWDAHSLAVGSRTQALSYATVNQEFQKFDITIREFLTLGVQETVSDAELWSVLEKVEFADYVRKLPQGLDTRTGVQWGGIDLSGGQWQRLCVARGMLSRTGLLFLDEPTSAIDAPTEERIFSHLAELSSDRLILLTTHRVSTLKDAKLIYVLEAGEIVESGSFAELNQPGTKFRALFEAQFVTEQEEQKVTTSEVATQA